MNAILNANNDNTNITTRPYYEAKFELMNTILNANNDNTYITTTRPYYEAQFESMNAQAECQKAAVQFQRAAGK